MNIEHKTTQHKTKTNLDLFCLFFLFQKGTKAPQAAGRIHTDFEKGFIMAEVMKFEDFRAEGSENACKVISPELLMTTFEGVAKHKISILL